LPIVWGRLRIRELTASDLDFVAEMLGNKDIRAYWPDRFTALKRQRGLTSTGNATRATAAPIGFSRTHSSRLTGGQVGLLALTHVAARKFP
jgi:hypothetical protein